MTDPPNPDAPPSEDDASSLFVSLRARNLGWLVRSIGASAIAATVLGVLVAPGLHGNASDAVVNLWDQASSVFAYAMAILLSGGIALSISELVASRRAETASGALIVGGSSLVVVLLVVAGWRTRMFPHTSLPEHITLGFAVVASGVASTAGFQAIRSPHTRALAIVLSTFALASLVRVGAWELAKIAGDQANAALYGASRSASTLGVVIEAFGQLAAAIWIGTRGRAGLVLSSLAAAAALAMTWGAAVGGQADAPHCLAALHASLGLTSTLPAPYALSGAASFLGVSAIALAIAALAQAGQPAAVCASLALALLSRGSLDAPLRAVAIVAAAEWAVVAAFDDRLLWASLVASRKTAPPPRR
jgi:hypothetical protein